MFTPYKGILDPEAMNSVLMAFELAWAEIMAHPNDWDVPMARDLIARRIVSAALEQSERDPERLKARALAGLIPRQPA